MALYQVNVDGNSPTHAKPGDYIATGAGTYEVMDSKIYSGMSKDQLAKAGVGFNPSTGLFSKKVSDNTNPYYSPVGDPGKNFSSLSQKFTGMDGWNSKGYSTVEDWKKKYVEQQTAQLMENYNNANSDINRSYNKARSEWEKQRNQVDSDYKKNRDELYEDAYYANKVNTEAAFRSGVTSATQARAQNGAQMWQVANKASQLSSDRDKLKNDINIEMNRLSEEYNINKDTLKQNFNASKLNIMSTAELQFLQACLEIDDYNAELWNNLTMNKYSMDRESQEKQKDRDFQSAEAQKDRDLQMQMLAKQMAGRSYGGGGYSRSSGGSKSGNSKQYEAEYNKAMFYYDQWQDKLSNDQKWTVKRMAEDCMIGNATAKDVNDYIYQVTYKPPKKKSKPADVYNHPFAGLGAYSDVLRKR